MKKRRVLIIALIAALLMAGCGASAVPSSDPVETEAGTGPETEADPGIEAAPEIEPPEELPPFEFDPHPHSDLLGDEIPQDHWEALYHLSDALRAGEDTFECPSQEAYDWCLNSVTLANLIPAACLKITGESLDGTTPYADGVGRIYYEMPAEDFVEREADFEQKVEDVLNNTLEKDDNEYEKCLKLYDYMASYYDYDYDEDDGLTDETSKDGYIYYTFMTHKGKCIDLSGIYAFLLLQSGVEALSVGSFDDQDHGWVYARVNGQGYHLDPTWALKSSRDTDELYLDYFMMSDEIRAATGCTVSDLTVQLLPQFWVYKSSISLPAADESYYLGEYATFIALDEENKILSYYDGNGVKQELSYGA